MAWGFFAQGSESGVCHGVGQRAPSLQNTPSTTNVIRFVFHSRVEASQRVDPHLVSSPPPLLLGCARGARDPRQGRADPAVGCDPVQDLRKECGAAGCSGAVARNTILSLPQPAYGLRGVITSRPPYRTVSGARLRGNLLPRSRLRQRVPPQSRLQLEPPCFPRFPRGALLCSLSF